MPSILRTVTPISTHINQQHRLILILYSAHIQFHVVRLRLPRSVRGPRNLGLDPLLMTIVAAICLLPNARTRMYIEGTKNAAAVQAVVQSSRMSRPSLCPRTPQEVPA
jgi:hypothetical protein